MKKKYTNYLANSKFLMIVFSNNSQVHNFIVPPTGLLNVSSYNSALDTCDTYRLELENVNVEIVNA